jgi:hypothetical protein
MFKKFIILFVTTLVLNVALSVDAVGGKQNKLTIVDNGKSNYAILIAPQALDSVNAAAQELQELIQKISGVKLPIQHKTGGNSRYIVIGKHSLAVKSGIFADQLPKDGFIIKTKSGNIFLLGKDYKVNKSRNFTSWSEFAESDSVGSYFAMVEFARRFLGVEWYMPTDKGIAWQPQKQLKVPFELNIQEVPYFHERFIDDAKPHSERRVKKLLKQNILRNNYYNAEVNNDAALWGRHMLLGNQKPIAIGHGWWQFIPPTKATNRSGGMTYGKSHPEYYALRDGVRQNHHKHGRHGAQLCVSNQNVIKTYAANIIAFAEKTKGKTFSLSANDGGEQCECQSCTALDGKDPVTGKTVLADRFIYFANKVAELVVKKIPDVRLGLYAYNSSLHSPTGDLLVHPNVYIGDVYNYLPNLWYSTIAERNKLTGYMQGWRQRAKHVFLVSYYNVYGNWGLPWDTTEVAAKTIQKLAQTASSDGMRMYNCRYFGISPGVDGARLWVLGRLYWNPNQNFNKLRNNYYNGAFGTKAGKYIKEYFDLINRSAIKVMKQAPMEIDNENIPLQCTLPEKIYIPIAKQCRQLINQAVAAVKKDNERIRWRVGRIAQAWNFTELTLKSFTLAQQARTGAYVETGLTLAQTWAKAVEAGRQRRKMLNSTDAYYALAQGSADICQKMRPLGVIEKMPENINLDVAVPLVNKPIVIDGKLNDKIWQKIPQTRIFKDNRTNKVMKIKTWAKIYRTADAFVIGIHCEEPYMNKLMLNNNPDSIWRGDVAELFISQTGTKLDFVQFLVNPNAVKKAYIMRGDKGMDNRWQPQWQANSFKGKNFWSTEMVIPFKSLGLTGSNIRQKTIFVNFCRERYANGARALSAWSPTKGSFAQPAKFGKMNFNIIANQSSINNKPRTLINILPKFTAYMPGWKITKVEIPKQWKTTTKVIAASKCMTKEHNGNYIFSFKDNKSPATYSIQPEKSQKATPGDKFLLKITYKRKIINSNKHAFRTPQVRIIFDQKNLGKKRLWFNSTTTIKDLKHWYTDEHKIYIDPASNVSNIRIKLFLFGENVSIKNIKLIKL